MDAFWGVPPTRHRAIRPIRQAPAVWELEGPTMTGPMMSRSETTDAGVSCERPAERFRRAQSHRTTGPRRTLMKEEPWRPGGCVPAEMPQADFRFFLRRGFRYCPVKL